MIDDTREKLEADVHRAADDMEMFTDGKKFINTHMIITWLNRQAAITKDEIEQTHMRLPMDKEGFYIRPFDRMEVDGGYATVMAVSETGWVDYPGDFHGALGSRHYSPETVEKVLRDFAIACEEQGYKDPSIDGLLAEFAKRIREAAENE